MKLSEIFNQLTYGELSQISLGGGSSGEITEANYPKVLSHINLGLTALHTRFPLKEGRLMLQTQPGMLTYPLNSRFAVGNTRSRELVRFIRDSASELFKDDIHKVERVYSGTQELGLNDESDPMSCFTPSAHVLRVPGSVVEDAALLQVVYRANHAPILVGMGLFDPTRVEVELPYSHLEPLLYFVASRVNNPMGMSNEFHAGNSYAAKYEAACQMLELQNLRVDQGSQNTRLERNGWV